MKVGDLVKIYPKHGAASYELGIYLGEWRQEYASPKRQRFLIGDSIMKISGLDFIYEVISEA